MKNQAGTLDGASNSPRPDLLQAVNPAEMQWIPWGMRGGQFKLLSADPSSGRFTILIKIEKGVTARKHRHIKAVEAYVLEGGFHYLEEPDRRFMAGSYLLESDGTVHQPCSPEGVVMLGVFHGPVEGLDDQGAVMGSIDWKWHVDAWNAAGGNYQP